MECFCQNSVIVWTETPAVDKQKAWNKKQLIKVKLKTFHDQENTELSRMWLENNLSFTSAHKGGDTSVQLEMDPCRCMVFIKRSSLSHDALSVLEHHLCTCFFFLILCSIIGQNINLQYVTGSIISLNPPPFILLMFYGVGNRVKKLKTQLLKHYISKKTWQMLCPCFVLFFYFILLFILKSKI